MLWLISPHEHGDARLCNKEHMNTLQKTLVMALLICSASATAQVVECTDASGKKTYAKECPEKTVKERELPNAALPSPGASNGMSAEKIRAANAAYEQRRAARQSANNAAQSAQGANTDKPNAQACAEAKSRLEAMQTGKQSRRADPVTGEHVPMDDSQRQSTIDTLNAQVEQNCK